MSEIIVLPNLAQENTLKKEMQSLRRKTDLREACMSRVPLEPTECFVTVKVRHVTMGKQERRFPSSSAMSSVLDWVGSLCGEPENFTLRDALALPLHPSNPIVNRSMIYMIVSDKIKHPLWLRVKFISEVLDGLITETMTPWRICFPCWNKTKNPQKLHWQVVTQILWEMIICMCKLFSCQHIPT